MEDNAIAIRFKVAEIDTVKMKEWSEISSGHYRLISWEVKHHSGRHICAPSIQHKINAKTTIMQL